MSRSGPWRGFSRDELDGLLSAAGVGAWVWEIGAERIRWNADLERLFGFDPGGFDGSFEAYIRALHPEDREAMSLAIQTALEERKDNYRVEHRILLADGSVRWIGARGRVHVDAAGEPTRMSGIAVDITHEQLQRQALADQEAAQRLYAEASSDYVYRADMSRPTAFPEIVAGSFERTTGLTPEDVARVGGWANVLHPDDKPIVARIYARLAEGLPFEAEYRIVRPDGSSRWLRDRARLLGGRWLVGGVQDISDRKALQEELIQARKLEALAQLAGGVAHDFNNLTTILHTGLALLAESVPKESIETLELLQQTSVRAAELTRSLLTFSRRSQPVRQAADLRSALEKALAMLRPALGPGIRLCWSCQTPRRLPA